MPVVSRGMFDLDDAECIIMQIRDYLSEKLQAYWYARLWWLCILGNFALFDCLKYYRYPFTAVHLHQHWHALHMFHTVSFPTIRGYTRHRASQASANSPHLVLHVDSLQDMFHFGELTREVKVIKPCQAQVRSASLTSDILIKYETARLHLDFKTFVMCITRFTRLFFFQSTRTLINPMGQWITTTMPGFSIT